MEESVMPWFPLDQYIWDFWFVQAGEDLHLFYLQADREACGHHPERRHNCATVGHARHTPWGWQELTPQQPALAPHPDRQAWDSLSIWTGSILEHPQTGQYYFFYTSRCRGEEPVWTPHEWQRSQQIGLALSDDLHHWQRWGNGPILPNPGRASGFDGVAWRDPAVIQGEEGRFYAFICARAGEASPDAGGRVVYSVSDDLLNWSTVEVLHQSDEFYQLEVPQVFWRTQGQTKRLYLLFSAQDRDCSEARYHHLGPGQCATGTYYLVSEPVPLARQTFPPLCPSARLLAPNGYAGKLLDPHVPEPLFFSFYWADGAGHFANGLAEPQRCRFSADGSLSLESGRTVAKLSPNGGEGLQWRGNQLGV